MAAHPPSSASKRSRVLSGVFFCGRSFSQKSSAVSTHSARREKGIPKRPASPPGGRRRGNVVCPFQFLAPPARGNGQRSQNPQGQKIGNKTLKIGPILHDCPSQTGTACRTKSAFRDPRLHNPSRTKNRMATTTSMTSPSPAKPDSRSLPFCVHYMRSAGTAKPPGRQPQITGTMFSQASEGLVRKASDYAVRLFYHADGGGIKPARTQTARLPHGSGPFIACAVIPAARTTTSRTRRRSRGDRRLPKRGSGIRRSFPRRASP